MASWASKEDQKHDDDKPPAYDDDSYTLYLHPMLFDWQGWGLSVPMPGKTLAPDGTVAADAIGEQDGQPDLAVKFLSVPGSLPRLRFGRTYWLRVGL